MIPQAGALTLFGTPNCYTVKRARTWLAGQGAVVEFHDFKRLGVPADALATWCAVLGWEQLLNRKGTTWRGLNDVQRAAVVDAVSAQALMLAQSSVIKRPVVVWPDGRFSVGFDTAEFSQRLTAPRGRRPTPAAPQGA